MMDISLHIDNVAVMTSGVLIEVSIVPFELPSTNPDIRP